MQVIIITIAIAAIVLAVYAVYASYGRMYYHFKRIRILNAREERWRCIRAGMYTPVDAFETKVRQMNEYEFETIVFNMYDKHPDTRLIAETRWSRYQYRIHQSQFKRIEVKGSPYPLGEERIVYTGFQGVSPPTLE